MGPSGRSWGHWRGITRENQDPGVSFPKTSWAWPWVSFWLSVSRGALLLPHLLMPLPSTMMWQSQEGPHQSWDTHLKFFSLPSELWLSGKENNISILKRSKPWNYSKPLWRIIRNHSGDDQREPEAWSSCHLFFFQFLCWQKTIVFFFFFFAYNINWWLT
jgi:hypothetical protein